MKTTLPAVLVIALAAAATAVAADEPTEEPPEIFANSAPQTIKKAIWGPTRLNGKSLFPHYRNLGIGIFQIQARWDRIAPDARPADPTDPSDPAYEWPAYIDKAVEEAERYGMKVQLMLIGAPSWSNGGLSWRNPPQDPQDYADFATAVSRRFPTVDLWMIWGEPNRKPNFGPVTPGPRSGKGPLNAAQALAPRLYAQLLDAAYGALKRDDPANLVIGGNTFTSAGLESIRTYQWIQYMRLPGGERPRMDMYGHNPWGFSKPSLKAPPTPRGLVTFSDLKRLAIKLDQVYAGERLPLFLSEWGVPIGRKDMDLRYGLKARQGKHWIRAGLRIARRWERIYTLGWIHPVDTDRNSVGLLKRNGKKKPGYKVYKTG
jgi:hypothetical protein